MAAVSGTADSSTFYSYGDTTMGGSTVQTINITRAVNPGKLALCEMKLFFGKLYAKVTLFTRIANPIECHCY